MSGTPHNWNGRGIMACAEFVRFRNSRAFSPAGWPSHNQHGTRYRYADGSALFVSSAGCFMRWHSPDGLPMSECLLAWHPDRNPKGVFVPLDGPAANGGES